LSAGNIGALNAIRGGTVFAPSLIVPGAAATAVTGAFRVPVILLAYKDVGVPFPASEYQRVLFSRAPGDRPYTITTYYEELSHHRISLDGTVFSPVRMDSVAAYYTDGCNGLTILGVTACPQRPVNRMGAMLVAALDSISNRPGADTVWSNFDNDGPDGISNSGDDDGVVDFVTFLQPEVGGECRSSTPPPTGIWSHRFVISAWVGQMYTTRTPRRGTNGLPIPGQFIRVNDYTIQSEVGGVTACDGSSIMAVGTVSHETGHAFGLPDLYDTQGATEGIGGWGLMGSGNYARPYSPSSYDAWSLSSLGWATIDTLGTSRTITTGARLQSDTIFYARTGAPQEYLLVENRQAVQSDTAQMNPALPATCPLLGFCAKSPGLLFWLVDQDRVNVGLLTNSVNTGTLQGVALIQADGLNQLRVPGTRNRGDRGDSYPGSSGNTRLSLLSNPGARDNFGQFLGFIVDRIEQLPGTAMRFRFTRRQPSLLQADHGGQIRVDGVPWDRYEEVIPGGDIVGLSVDPVQVIAAGRTRLTFLSWSDQGPRDRTLVSNPARPDTLTAGFAVEHRLLVASSGSGTVTASVAGNLSQGVYLAEASAVTVTAAAAPGFAFVGWRGDTVATAAVLGLTMRKGYDLEARFVTEMVIPVADAVADLLGTPRLSLAERNYLDELGNRNGQYDVGDLLALYQRSGVAAPPSLLQARPAPRSGVRRP
ncbi:MAG TPA: M6 family metalloprotease domain-containing protein, partial [Gemmatimonadales bacterium]